MSSIIALQGFNVDRCVELSLLIDLYGPLLTERRQSALRLHCEEDMSYQEIAERLGISRQGVCDAVTSAVKQLERYEAALGLMEKLLKTRAEAAACRRHLEMVEPTPETRGALGAAIAALDNIDGIEG